MAHAAAHAVHQLAHHCQADTLAAFAGAEEGQEDLAFQAGRHAGTVVAHADLQPAAAPLAGLHPQAWLGLLGGGLLGVGQQREQRLLQLPFVGLQAQARLGKLELGLAATRRPRRADSLCSATGAITGSGQRLTWR
jgi:hypothetical protein